jgi:hypothetical protein
MIKKFRNVITVSKPGESFTQLRKAGLL